uniref:VLIG-type G domain-containing protein n=1 Tax=Pelusios castaneus TaxID=367368 RepID=A0A8C8VQB3_9SAUR
PPTSLGDPAKDELAKRLEAVGLSAEYWLPKLHEQLAVTSTQALKHLQHEDYWKLECDVQHTWEKQALQKLFQIDSKATVKQLQEERLEMLKKRQEQAKLALQELKEMQEKGRSRQEEAVRKKEEELRQAMDIAPEYWAPAERPLTEVMENVHKQLHQQEESLSQSENVSDEEVLRRVSGGLALQGIYKTHQLADMVGKREQLITVPEGFELFGPEQQEKFEKKEFLSSKAESTFTRTMEKLGLSFSIAAKEGFGGAETSSDYSQSEESEETHRSCSEHTYICTTQYSYIPLASCYLPKDQLRLSSVALQELKEMEQILSHTPELGKLTMLQSRGGRFFQRFGSHVNQGPLHFGGIFWWKASSEGFRAEQLDEVKKQTSAALSSYVGGSYSSFGYGAAGGINVSKSDYKTSLQGTDTKTFQPETHLLITRTGGPPGMDSLTAWKSGLLANNKTWAVIDRGSQLIPVWDIILANHRQDFKDVYQVGSSLMRAYEALPNLSANPLSGEELASAMEEARSLLEEMKTWEVTEDEEQLVTLLRFKKKLNEKTKHNTVWINICLSDKVLQDFLENTVLLCKVLPAQKTKSTKSLLRCLLDPHVSSVKNFPQTSSIMQWIFQDEEKPQKTICVSEFADFVQVLQEMKSHIQEVTKEPLSSLAEVEEAKKEASLCVSLALSSLVKTLRGREQLDIESLVLSVAVGAGYRVESDTFQCLLGCRDVDFMLKEMQRAHETYLTLREQDVSRAQAFLLLTGLTTSKYEGMSWEEEKKKYLTFLEDHMGNLLSPEIDFVLRKHRACTDWKALERDLNSLVNGNSETTNDYQQKEYIKKELENAFQETEQVHSLVSTTKEVQSSNMKTDEFLNPGFLKLIKQLKLENYYPKKLGVADFQKIHKASLYDTYPSNASDLPFYFLVKLLMLDYRVRYLICKDDIKTEQDIANILNTSDDANEPLDNVDDIFNDVCEESNEFATSNEGQVHPMDIQMAIFHCADDFMRQYISTKLSLCQFALPLLVPDPRSSRIEFPFWSVCQVKKTWQSHEQFQNMNRTGKCKDQWIYQADIPVVSFCRFGGSSFSKSQLLNTLLSKQKHGIFFHRHCKGSIENCLLMEGVVEITWYCPGRNNDDSFDNCIAFTNLHGDAREHERQVNFLQEIASVNVVLLSDTDKNEKGTKALQDLLNSPKPLIFLFTDRERVPVNKSGKRVKIAAKNQNEAKLIDELTTAIKRAIGISNISCSLGKCANIARKHGFLVDEDNRECKEGKEQAQKVIGFLKQENIVDIKEKLLPLQGELWHKWCKKDKEHTRLQDNENMSIEQHRSQIKSAKHAIRQAQLQRAFPLNGLMQSVLSALNSPSHETKMYFLQWLKILIADVSSDHLPELHQKYHDLWSETLAKKRRGDNDLQKQLEKLSHEISESTVGLEHLLREVGQIYEALDALPEQDKCFLKLPQIVADLMVEGYPIELMDGDISYMPLKWVGAIFDKLIEKLGDKKVFVLSVLGIQSTGKSTLLNAMFGLQFRVSAGRCTRGAFMQLVKVDDELREDLNFDFMVVIDTEGLRATKLENRSILSHDNELATFVIGLGNTTLINIYGENPSEMQDVLQITVQAFLRMKQVKLSPSCLFVHQNVGDITAKEKNMEGRRCLQEKLDEMAVTAGQQESYDVTCFNDVIQFDVNTHIHYFAHLWEGDPPMAPPNPSYSQNVQELKREILTATKQKSKHSFLRLSELKTRTQDLWQALLNENFVFSFKNTLEIAVYSRLENNYNKWTWELRRFMLDLQKKLNIQIQNGRISKIDQVDLENRVQEKYDAIEKELERYFSEDKDSNILIQWEKNIKTRMKFLRQEQIDKICQKVKERINLRNRQSRFEQKKSTYKDELLRKSKELARDYRDKELSESELRESFMSMWKEWVIEVSSSAPRIEEPNINADMERFLLNHFTSEPNIRNRIKTSSEWTVFPLNPAEHISMKRRWYELRKTATECDIGNLKTMTAHLEWHISDYIENKKRERMDYNSSYFHEIVELIRTKLESDSRDENFTLTQTYKVDVSLYLCQMATRNFRETFKAFQKSNDPVLYLESKKEEFFSCFKIACQGATSITTFANTLCSRLALAMGYAVCDRTALDIVNEMKSECPAFSGNRKKLDLFMLSSLLEEEDFETYQQYIYNPRYYMQDFIRRSVDSYCLDKNNPNLKNFLNLNLDAFHTLVLSALHEATKIAKDKHGNVALWLDEFCTRLGDDLYLSRDDLKSIEHQEIKDIQFLKEAVSDSLIPALGQLKKTFTNIDMERLASESHEILFEQLCGCMEQCPFCKAVCTNTIPRHDGNHSTDFHRPQALSGIQWEGTNHLVIDICSSLVASDHLIVHNGKKTSCKNYREVGSKYENWDIKPSTFQLPYWQWFVSHFRSRLQKVHKGKFKGKGAIPADWENLDKNKVRNDMKVMLQMFEKGLLL